MRSQGSPTDSPVPPGRQRQLLTVALMLSMGVVALEGTVVTTALPTVVGELHGLSLYPWVFSLYLLTSTTTVPIYGKAADILGRKPVFLVGLGLFLAGTLLCGAATSMIQLVAFRAIQGIGAGAVQPLTLTVLGDIYNTRERAKVQPLTAGVWGILSLVGPAYGAVVTERLSWRWVFWSNVPLCLLALGLIWTFLRERVERHTAQIDVAGAVTLTAGLVGFLLMVLEGGEAFPWRSWQAVGLGAAVVACFVAFAWVERRAADPVLPFGALRLRVVAVSNLGNAGIGLSLYGLTSYVPLFAQSVRGESATGASAVLTPFMVGWSLMALVSGRLYLRIGFRNAGLLGTILAAAGTAPLALLGPDTPLVVPSVAMGLTGLGLGVVSPTFLLAPQAAVPWRRRGAVTSSIQFSRTIAGSMGVALLGAVLNARLGAAATALAAQTGSSTEQLTGAMLNPSTRAAIAPETLAALVGAMADGLHRIYVALALLAALGVLQIALFARNPGRDVEGASAAPSDRPMEPAAGLV